ncbi:MAG TPA: winged helix-turn-helix domain-containing protein [Actinomycetota bacterium]|nr:winged helix-turn-helix domain-containing protein [Actinomycetota bacterium]
MPTERESTRVEPKTLRLTEPAQMRALTHPLRLRLLGLLRSEGPATATTLAGRLGVSPALASYHLRQLGSHGFIEPAPELARDGKERWWRATHERTSWSTAEWLDTPERVDAEQAFGREIVRAVAERGLEWVTEASTWPPEWVDAADMSDWLLELTAEEVRELRGELHEVIDRWSRRPRRPGTERVHAVTQVFPRRRADR